MAALEAFWRYPQAIPALESLGVSKKELRGEMRALIERIMGGYAARRGKALWIDKTPNYYRILPFLDDVFGHEARFLFLARHPLDCAASLSAMYDAREPFADPEIARSVAARGRGLRAWCGYWDEVYSTLLDFRDGRAGRCLVFRYEDLVGQTRATLDGILQFLGEPAPADLSLTWPPERRGGYEDAGIRDTDRVMTDRMGRWREWPRQEVESCWALVAERAAGLGYAIDER